MLNRLIDVTIMIIVIGKPVVGIGHTDGISVQCIDGEHGVLQTNGHLVVSVGSKDFRLLLERLRTNDGRGFIIIHCDATLYGIGEVISLLQVSNVIVSGS